MESDLDLAKLEKDDVFSQFLKDDFHVNVFASQSLQGALVSELLPKLISGIAVLDKELLNQVSAHYEDLLSQATGIETLEGVLAMMQVRIQTLLSAVERLRTKLVEPYTKIASHTKMLSRLQLVCDLLRRVTRVIFLSKRLHSQLQGGNQEITKVAQSLSELDYLLKSGDLNGLDIIEKEQIFVRQSRKQIEKQAEQMINRGMESQNQSQVATALQVFFNLSLLVPMVRKCVETLQTNLTKNVQDALDVFSLSQPATSELSGSTRIKGGPGRATMPSVGSAVAFRANLWTNIEKLTNQIYSACTKVMHLQRVLAKKRDPLTHVCFLDELSNNGGEDIFPNFWNFITKILEDEFNKAANDSSSIKQAFEGEYPKLVRNFADLWKRLESFCNSTTPSLENENINLSRDNNFDCELALRGTLSQFEQAYLSRSLSRLFDPINIMFGSEGNIPSPEETNGVVRVISSELGFALVDPELYKTIAKNVAKTVKLFTVRCEQMLCTDGEASQVISPNTPGQILNFNIVTLLSYFRKQILNVIDGLTNSSPEAYQTIIQSLDSVTSLIHNAINPLLKSVGEAIEDIILTLHNEDYGATGNNDNSNSSCSLYMNELQAFISRAHTQYLVQYESVIDDFMVKYLHPLACRGLNLLVRQVSLVRPLSSSGKMRLASDLAQMESAVAPLCRRVGDLGHSYRLIRAFRPLLFQNPSHIAQSSSLGEIVPYSTVLHFLFSNGPPDMLSPHQTASWSIARYSQWLDEHSEKEILHLIQGSLEAYAFSIKQKQAKEYAPVYPTMLNILQKAIQINK